MFFSYTDLVFRSLSAQRYNFSIRLESLFPYFSIKRSATRPKTFCLVCLAVPKQIITFAVTKQNSVTYHLYIIGIETIQRNRSFSASFNAYYLAGPNNLLTHTHTQASDHNTLRVRARGMPRNPYRQRTFTEFPLFHDPCPIRSNLRIK